MPSESGHLGERIKNRSAVLCKININWVFLSLRDHLDTPLPPASCHTSGKAETKCHSQEPIENKILKCVQPHLVKHPPNRIDGGGAVRRQLLADVEQRGARIHWPIIRDVTHTDHTDGWSSTCTLRTERCLAKVDRGPVVVDCGGHVSVDENSKLIRRRCLRIFTIQSGWGECFSDTGGERRWRGQQTHTHTHTYTTTTYTAQQLQLVHTVQTQLEKETQQNHTKKTSLSFEAETKEVNDAHT